jgi:hypothetical protein
MRKFLAVYSFYLGVALVITWPLLTVIDTRFIGHPFGDTYEYAHHIWWIKYALQTGQPLFFQPLLGYPDGLNSLWLWAVPLQSFPAWLFAFCIPLPAAFNLSALLRLALNGWAMQALAYDLTGGKRGPALLAGLIFMLFPAFQGQLAVAHTGLLALWPVPLYVLALRRVQDTSSPSHVVRLLVQWRGGRGVRWLLTAALLFAVSLWGSILLLLYLLGPVTLVMLGVPVAQRNWPGLRRTVIAVILGGCISLIFIGPFLVEELAKPLRLAESGDVRYSADLLTAVAPSFYHPLFAHLPYTHQVLGIDPFERMGYIGILAGMLALIGVLRQRTAHVWLMVLALAWVFSLGPLLKVLDQVVSVDLGEQVSYVTLPWLAFQDLPLINSIRTPARFNFMVALPLAIMAGYGAGWLWDRLKAGRWPVFSVLMLLVIFEYQSFWPIPTVPGTVPPEVAALAERDDVRAVLTLPWDHLLAEKDGMFLQTGHHKPLITGQVTRRTPVDPAKLAILQETLDPALLDREGADIIILHKEWAADAAAMQAAIPGDLLYEDERIAMYEVSPPENEPQFTGLASDDPMIEGQNNSYIFAPESGWTRLTGSLQANGRNVMLRLDDEMIQAWRGMESITLDIPIPLSAGYHTVTLAVELPCPQHFAPSLRCQSVAVDDLAFGDFEAQPFVTPIMFGRGVELAGYGIDGRDVRLWWRFGERLGEDDIRFVHVVNADGVLADQDDRTLGVQVPDNGLVEEIRFDDLPPGLYNVYTGWYAYPDFTRFPVLSDVFGAADSWVHLGRMVVED